MSSSQGQGAASGVRGIAGMMHTSNPKRKLLAAEQFPSELDVKPVEHDCSGHYWTLQLDDGGLLGLFVGLDAKKGPREKTYKCAGYVGRIDYDDDVEGRVLLAVRSKMDGPTKNVILYEDFLDVQGCKPKSFRQTMVSAVQANKNLIPVLFQHFLPFNEPASKSLTVESPVREVVRRKKGDVAAHTGVVTKKQKVTATQKEAEGEQSVESSGGPEFDAPGFSLGSGIVDTKQNVLRESIRESKLVDVRPFEIQVRRLHRPPVDAGTGRRPLEVREPHSLHVANLKAKMKINPFANVVPFLCMVDPNQCAEKDNFDPSRINSYDYFVIGGCHSAEARRQLCLEYPDSAHFKTAECKIFAGLSKEEAVLLAWDHNNDNDYRQGMSFIQRIRFFHNEYLDFVNENDKPTVAFRIMCCRETGLVFDENKASDALRRYDQFFQLAFRSGLIWDLQDEIFTMWEKGEVKGQKQGRFKEDPNVMLKGKHKRADVSVRQLSDEMKITYWRSMQGIKEEKIISSALARVVSKEFSLDDMSQHFEEHKIFMRMQEQLMVRLNVQSWDEVRADYPLSSSSESLKPFYIVFQKIKTRAKSTSLEFPCPSNFLAHIEAARLEKERREKGLGFEDTSSELKVFNPIGDPLRANYYNVIVCDIKDFTSNMPKKDYKLAIADIPYGFRLKGSSNDQSALTYKQVDAMVSAFRAFNTAKIWTFIIFHSNAQAASVLKALKDSTHAVESMMWVKTNLRHVPGNKMIHCFEMLTVGYYAEVEKKKTDFHCSRRNVSNVLQHPAVTRKLRFVDSSKAIVNPYQKPQRLINDLLDLFSLEDEWICDFFAGTGTTTVCALQKNRHCIAVEKDPVQAAFLCQRINALNDLPDADQEVGAKFSSENDRVQEAAGEPQPPIQDEEGELAELWEELDVATDSQARSSEDVAQPCSPQQTQLIEF